MVRLGRTSFEVGRFVLGCAPLAGLYSEVGEGDPRAGMEPRRARLRHSTALRRRPFRAPPRLVPRRPAARRGRAVDQGRPVPALAELRAAGAVGAIGAGMNNCPPLERIVEEIDVDLVRVAGRYNLLDQEAAHRLPPLCAERGVAVLVAGVFASEVLARPGPNAHFRYAPASAEVLERTEQIREVCHRHGVALPAAAMQLPLRHPAVTAVVVGARSAKEVAEDLAYFTTEVPEALYAELRDLGLVEA